VRWVGFKDPYSGVTDVYLDGKQVQAVDDYAAASQPQAVLYSVTGLPAATHEFALVVTGQKNSSAKQAWIWVDAFESESSGTSPVC
jgi:hypothetical protein